MRLGDAEIWKILIEELKASMDWLMMSFTAIRKTPMDIICENGLLEVLKYLFPIYLKHMPSILREEVEDVSDVDSVFHENGPLSPAVVRNTQWAILRAWEHGRMDCVKYIFQFFKGKTGIANEFNVHAEDERTGENSTLIAARTGNFALLNYLHS